MKTTTKQAKRSLDTEAMRLTAQITYSFRDLFEWDDAMYPADNTLSYGSANEARQAAKERQERQEKATPCFLTRLPKLRRNPDTLPSRIEHAVTSSVFTEFNHDFINPLELGTAYTRLNYSEKLVMVYRLGLGYTWREIAEVLKGSRSQFTQPESAMRHWQEVYKRTLNKLVEALRERDEVLTTAG